MKPRIRAYTNKYDDWLFFFNRCDYWGEELIKREIAPRYDLHQMQREHNYRLSQAIEDAAYGVPRFEVNTDVMMPYCKDPNTALMKYVKQL